MNEIRVAISAPMTIPLEHLKKVKHELMSRYQIRHSYITYWDRQSAYDQHEFESANAVIVIADSKFGFNCKTLAPGVSKELTEAYYNSKPVFVAYENSNGQINFYSVDLKSTDRVMKVIGFSGIQGSSGKGGLFEKLLNNYAEVNFNDKPAEYTDKPRQTLQNQQAELERSVIKMIHNSTYGVRCVDSSYNSEQIKFPEMRRVYANTIPNPDYVDNRLLLML